MIEEQARVTRVTAEEIYVETMRKGTCSACKASAGCGNALLDSLFPGKRHLVRVLPAKGIETGDDVIIGLDEGAILKGSFILYTVPLFLMISLPLLLSLLVPAVSEGWTVLAGISGLLLGFFLARSYSASIKYDERYQPVIVRKLYGP